MAAGNIDYSAVLADLEARKAQVESAIAAVKNILASAGVMGTGGSGGVITLDNIPTGAFLRLSIADATKKFLDMVKSKQSVPQIMQALERGGLPPAKYNTVYAVLRRRESQFGDIRRMGDEWGLTEWYPNNPNLRARNGEKASKKKSKKKGSKKTAAKGPTAAENPAVSPKKASISKADAAEKILQEAAGPLHAKAIAESLNQKYGKDTNARIVAGALFQDPKKRFRNLGENTWELVQASEK